jgi:hypothetical protein
LFFLHHPWPPSPQVDHAPLTQARSGLRVIRSELAQLPLQTPALTITGYPVTCSSMEKVLPREQSGGKAGCVSRSSAGSRGSAAVTALCSGTAGRSAHRPRGAPPLDRRF